MSQRAEIDRTGQRYGRWVVIDRASNVNARTRRWNCKCDCGTLAIVHASALAAGGSTSCGCRRKELAKSQPKREKAGNWRGGRYVDQTGYVFIYAPEHPKAKSKKYVTEHVLVMEKRLGRFLIKGEFVHHKNGNKQDNRIENLELWTRHHPYGQRVMDQYKWALEIIELYKPVTHLLL